MPEQRRYPPSPGSRLPHVGTYRRALDVSLERMYENALDWEHLPYVHRTSFTSIRCERADASGWRAAVTTPEGKRLVLDLALQRDRRRWITCTVEGGNAGTEVWTHAFAVSARRTDIVVDFFVPGVAEDERARIGRAFGDVYERLYDEDVAMMQERQIQLDRRIEAERGGEAQCLGRLDTLALPLRVEFGGRAYVVTRVDGQLLAHVARCPHQLGPLEPASDGVVQCPWHGYRFDAKSGTCLSGQPCRLPRAPSVSVRNGSAWLER
jgi:nitrite reductase/ring-hydroxylating ferredoxin subunit